MANKLELTWVGKDTELKVEPRILIENPVLSNIVQDSDTENMLIHGDNLLALKALESKYAGKVKCIYIDPPYNTGSAFENYDDNLEHSIWLGLMRERLKLLYSLLGKSGTLWISIDDDEQAYLKVLCDEIFGRSNFVTCVLWQKIHSIKNDAKYLSVNHDYILVYAKDKERIHFNLLPRTEEMDARYTNPDNDPRGAWQSGDLVANEERINGHYAVKSPITGKIFDVPQGKHWVYSQENLQAMIEDNRLYFGKNGNAFPRKKRFLSEVMQGRKGDTWWTSSEVGHNQEAKREIIKLFSKNDIFATPKPERLIERILTLASDEGDIVLDSFLGSGTTAAVAHKIKRRYVGIEMGNQVYSFCKVRLDKVISGEDKGGITKSVNWTSGGGYKFYELAPSLILQDDFGQEIINPEYNAEMLASAVALHEGYTYAPDESCYFKQAFNGSNAFLYVTTRHINKNAVNSILTQLQDNEYLIIVCKSFDSNAAEDAKNITLKKIPQSLLDNCEFGKDDYKLNIVNPPTYEDEELDDNE